MTRLQKFASSVDVSDLPGLFLLMLAGSTEQVDVKPSRPMMALC